MAQGKKVLVVGGGGRCHAIVDALSRSPQVAKIYTLKIRAFRVLNASIFY